MASWQERIAELGLTLPEVSAPVAAYIPARVHNDLVLVSGQLPLENGQLLMQGPLSPGIDLAAAQSAMARCFINGLAAAASVAGDRELIGVLRLAGFVAATPDFPDHHKVTNGASELAQEIFGQGGVHVRAAVGVASLPLNASVELELTFELA